ncbi:FYVE zinc finger [Trichuris suis]|nr:FYVE zinc finger [Trichuris suis]
MAVSYVPDGNPLHGFICPECRNSFLAADRLQEHYEEVHSSSGQSKTSNGTVEHRSLLSKLAAFAPAIRNTESEPCDSITCDAEYSINDSSFLTDATKVGEEGKSCVDEYDRSETLEDLYAEVRRLSMENEALKRHVQDAEGKCDTMKTCLSDMESSNKMLQSQLAMYKTEVSLLTDQIALKARKVPTRDVIVGPDEVSSEIENSSEDIRSIEWFYDTVSSYFSQFDSLKPLFRFHKFSTDLRSSLCLTNAFSESPVCERPECERPVVVQTCSSTAVRELASSLISEFEFLRAKCRMFLAKGGSDIPSDKESLDKLCESDPLRVVYENLEKENKTLQEKLRIITASVDRKDQESLEMNSRLNILKREVNAINEEKSRYVQQVEALKKVNEEQDEKAKFMQMELRSMKSVNAELEKSKTEQTIAIGKMEEQLSKTTMERDEHKSEIIHLLAALDMATEKQISEKQDWENERDRLTMELKEAMERIVYLESSLDSVTEKYQEQELMLHQRVDTMTDQLVELRKEVSKNRSVIDKLEQERSAASDRCDGRIKLIFYCPSTAKCFTKFAALIIEAEGAKREMKAAVCQFEDLEAEYSNRVYEYDELQRKYNEVLGALQDIGLQHSHLQVDVNQFLTRRWVDDATVTSCRCGKMFSVTVRKHHCRNCGSIFCNDCSNKSAMVASSKRPVRVCDACFEKLSAQ